VTETHASPERRLKWALRLASLIVFALGWEWAAQRIHSLLLPGFFATLKALIGLVASPVLWDALWLSNQAMLLGFAVGAITGVPLGLLIGRWPLAERFADPYLTILLTTPMSPLIPIIIMATGLGIVSRVMVISSFAFVVIAVNTRAGLRALDPAWTEMARSFGATEAQMWRKILLPGAFPAIVTGLRLGLARSFIGMLVVELLLLSLGIGRLILDFQGTFESAQLYATVFVVVAEAMLLMQGCKWLEQRAAPWLGQVAVR
jgi:ABC-type nitrate/sulfonate/bicarbonate transport system permease component